MSSIAVKFTRSFRRKSPNGEVFKYLLDTYGEDGLRDLITNLIRLVYRPEQLIASGGSREEIESAIAIAHDRINQLLDATLHDADIEPEKIFSPKVFGSETNSENSIDDDFLELDEDDFDD